ncbi:TIR domain-containing protein [Microbacterium sp. 3J1]|uniref:TIR domain-containing protein n=1 Tax=Microbacterium sp. 3J1 TaxID=861269 RepID=UPI000AB2C48B|nr:nucleotide-binding protein [Microbacterium sp. 3J1]
MKRKTANYRYVHFDSATIKRAVSEMQDIGRAELKAVGSTQFTEPVLTFNMMSVARYDEEWTFDSIDEFLADLTKAGGDPIFEGATVWVDSAPPLAGDGSVFLRLNQYPEYAKVQVEAHERAYIERVHSIFGEAAATLRKEPPAVPEPPTVRPRIFIGHGGASTAWHDLLHHLNQQHGLEVIAYETGSRAGHSIRDILEDMLAESTFAILVMSKEDEQVAIEGEKPRFRARQNVVHEAGLFQGRLGFSRAIIVKEDDVEMLSNVEGVQYVPFTSHIRETYGEVLAAIRREFGAF